MVDLNYIRSFFPSSIAKESRFDRYMLKEYLLLLVLDHLATTQYIGKMTFIGGTNLRLIHSIDRFSEDLDFDCKDMTEEEFVAMTDSVILFLQRNNINVEPRDKRNPKLVAFRRNLYFPEMLFDLGLTGHREERLLLKIEAQDQKVAYQSEIVTVNKMGFFFNIQVAPLDVLCAMKFAAILSRQKGRDFYDAIFLLSKTKPSIEFLHERVGIGSIAELKETIAKKLLEVDLSVKKKDFVHLLFNENKADCVLEFDSVVSQL